MDDEFYALCIFDDEDHLYMRDTFNNLQDCLNSYVLVYDKYKHLDCEVFVYGIKVRVITSKKGKKK